MRVQMHVFFPRYTSAILVSAQGVSELRRGIGIGCWVLTGLKMRLGLFGVKITLTDSLDNIVINHSMNATRMLQQHEVHYCFEPFSKSAYESTTCLF